MPESVTVETLDGRDPLAFLAGLGALRAISAAHPGATLAWNPDDGLARFGGPWRDLDGLGDSLTSAVADRPDEELSFGLPAELIPRKVGSKGSDPAKLDSDGFREKVGAAGELDAPWVAALWTDLAFDDEGLCARTPFYAPTGQQTLRSMFEKPRESWGDRAGDLVGELLSGWQRANDFTGENLDARAVREAASQPDGKSSYYGAPAPTWFALAAIPYFRLSGEGVEPGSQRRGQRSLTVGWQRIARGRGPRMRFGWPLWARPLDAEAVQVLLDHPDVARATRLAAEDNDAPASLAALSVWAVVVARRQPTSSGQSAGILTVDRVARVR